VLRRPLRTFLFSVDGIAPLTASVGADVEIPDEICAGLEREGYIAPLAPPASAALPAAPETKRPRSRR
jgi:hypothetical protein